MDFISVYVGLQLICTPPLQAPKEFEVQKLVVTQRQEDLKFDLNVDYYTYGAHTSIRSSAEVELEAINLPTPYGQEVSSYEVKCEAGDWFLYEYTLSEGVIVKPIQCEYKRLIEKENQF